MITFRKFTASRDPAADDVPPVLLRFVLLSLLVHVLVVVVFGNAGGGGARRDDAAWGGLDVTLRRSAPETGAGIRLAPGTESETTGASLLRRLGGARSAPVTPQLAKPSAAPPAQPSAPTVAPAPAATDTAPRPAEPAPPPGPTLPFEALPALNREAPEEVDKPVIPNVVTPPKVERAPSPPVEPKAREAPSPKAEAEVPVVPAASPPPREVPVVPAAPPSPREVPVVPAAPLPPREVPVTPPPQPVERAPLPKPEPEVVPTTPPLREAPVAPAALPASREVPVAPAPVPQERTAPPRAEPQPLSPAAVAPLPKASSESIAPPASVAPKVEREAPSPATSMPGGASTDAAPRVERPAAPPAASTPAPARPAAVAPPARAEPPSGEALPRLRFGAPDPGDEIFRSRGEAAPRSTEPGGAPRPDPGAPRDRARESAGDALGYRGVVPLAIPLPPPEKKTKLGEAIDKAQKPDCRDAYAAMGLLAVVPLVASTVGNGGCRW